MFWIAGFLFIYFSSLSFFINVSSQETAGHPAPYGRPMNVKCMPSLALSLDSCVQTQLSCRLTIYVAGFMFKAPVVTRGQKKKCLEFEPQCVTCQCFTFIWIFLKLISTNKI